MVSRLAMPFSKFNVGGTINVSANITVDQMIFPNAAGAVVNTFQFHW